MKISWQVDDGYVGKDRLQTTTVNDDELLECDSVEEALGLITKAIEDDFEQKILADWDVAEVQAKLEELFANKSKE